MRFTKLSVTGYVVSQSDLLSMLEFVYGQFKTYQVAVSAIENLSGLDFGSLGEFDPMRAKETSGTRELITASDIVVT